MSSLVYATQRDKLLLYMWLRNPLITTSHLDTFLIISFSYIIKRLPYLLFLSASSIER
jgi:hypothetical protein